MSDFITDLQESLPIPPGGIASRPLLDLKGSTKLVLFALDRDQEISAHSAPWPAQVLVLAGSLQVMVDGAWSTLKPQERIELPKGLAHGVKALEGAHFLLTMLR